MRAIIDVELPEVSAESGDPRYMNVPQIHKLLEELRLQPSDMPGGDWNVEKDRAQLQSYFRTRAEEIFHRMPAATDDERKRKRFAEENIIYASEVPPTSTPFMVVTHTNAHVRFRLSNSRLEDLQQGCKNLVDLIDAGSSSPNSVMKKIGDVRVFEHGHEDSTIRGEFVTSRIAYARRHAAREILTSSFTALIFVLALIASSVSDIQQSTDLLAFLERLMTAMFAAAVVALVNVYFVGVKAKPTIEWSFRLDRHSG
jgi:hypothetical protein